MPRSLFLVIAAAGILAGCGRDGSNADKGNAAEAAPDRPAGEQAVAGVTPMGERVAVLGFLNKRNGIVRNLSLKPGQSVRVKDAIVRLRACETTAPWETQKLTGAFIQLDVQRPDDQFQRVFSGWVYKESPSLNVIEHPVYDVWPKSCTMTFPAGPAAPAPPTGSSKRSSVPKSGGSAAARPSRPAEPAEAPPSPPTATANAAE